MHTPLVEPFDRVDGDPARYVEYLRDCYRTAARILREPVQQWPRGDSHSISREIQALATEYAFDVKLEFGLFDAYGKLTGYATH